MKTCTTCGAEWPDDTRFCPTDGTTLRSAGGTDLVGAVIADRYHIEKKLGEGGMGAVYLGEHVKMGRKSAIKVMTQSMAHDPEAIARFNREAANAARINHPNVCAIYDFGETADGLIYLAMEFIEGESLNDTLHREGAFTPKRAANILKQTADALQVAHDLGIVHRDLKPDNIMIARGRANDDLVKVVDFGIAKAMTGEEGQKVTKTGLVVGTPEYMSPEQLSGDVLDGRSDLYSLALVFYRMLTGTLPFHADSAQETMIKRLTDDPMPLAEAAPGTTFPPALQQAMDKALARMPSQRYATASAFAADAVAACSGMANEPPRPSMTEARTQVLDAAGATELLPETRVSKAAMRRPEDTPATPAPKASPAAPGKKKAPVAAIVGAVVVIAGGGGALAMLMGGGEAPANEGMDSTAVNPPATVEQPAAGPGTSQPQTTPPQNEVQRPTTERQPPATVQDPPATTVTPTGDQPASLATAAIEQELDEFNTAVDSSTATAADRRRIERLYDDETLPASLRARAALLVGSWHVNLSDADDGFAVGCRWYRDGLAVDSDNSTLQTALNGPACRNQ